MSADDATTLDDYGKETFEELERRLDFASGNMLSKELSLNEVAPWYEDFTDAMRAHALLWLLVEGDAQTCFRDLTLSGQVRRHFLRRAQRDNKEIYLAGSSRVDPFFDAVAAQSLDVAKDIAALASADWLSKDEYEDDYCYARFLYLLVAGPADQRAGEMSDLLARFERVLDGDESPRLQVCRSLLARDSDAFGQAFADLLSERAAEVKEKKPRATANPVARLSCEVFVEGLALLRFADTVGLRTDPDYAGCPQLARVPSQVGTLPDTLPAR